MSQFVLRIDRLRYAGHTVSLALAPAETAVVGVESDYAADRLLRILVGLEAPDGGSIVVLGEDLAALSTRQLERLRGRILAVPSHGGVISNLDVWENLLLPTDYHRYPQQEKLLAAGRAALALVGYRGDPHARISTLTPFQRRQIVLARALPAEPRLLCYVASEAGLSPREREAVWDILLAVRRELPQLALCCITAAATGGERLAPERRIELAAGDDR